MLLNNVDWSSLVSLTAAGLKVADFVQVRTYVTKRYKEIYGDDIDVSTGSADGIYIENQCLIINNILQSFKTLYASLDVRQASGKALEMLARLSNIYRLAATKSTVALEIESEVALTVTSITFLDNNGNTWTANASDIQLSNFSIPANKPYPLIVVCDIEGPIQAQAGTVANDYTDGWINRTVDIDASVIVRQKQNAIPGEPAENDAKLRARLNSTTGRNAVSVLEALAGSLFEINGIQDIKLYNNVVTTTPTPTAKDGTVLTAHTVYVILRQHPNAEISDNLIGTTIYEHMTPGIPTIETDQNSGNTGKSFTYTQYFLDTAIVLTPAQNVFWAVASTIHPTIKITISPKEFFSADTTPMLIASAVIKFANDLRIGQDLMTRDIDDVVQLADPLFRGRATFDILSIKDGSDNTKALTSTFAENADHVFSYQIENVIIDDTDPNSIIITIA